MKFKKFFLVLAAEAIVLFAILAGGISVDVFSIIRFPFAQVGTFLRALSLSGAVGNTAAWCIWMLVGLLPLYPVLRRWGEKSRLPENILWILLSASLFFALYCMINPSVMSRFATVEVFLLPAVRAVICGVVWSVVVCLLTVYLLRKTAEGGKKQLLVYLRRMLYVLCMLFTAIICLTAADTVMGITEGQTLPDRFMIVIGCGVSILPYLLHIFVVLSAYTLFGNMLDPEKAEDVVPAAKRLAALCSRSLLTVAASGMLYNIVQLLLGAYLTEIHTSVQIPLFHLVFVLAVFLLARLLAENKKLSDDNNLFI